MGTGSKVRISVVIPCFNGEDSLHSCLGSFLRQSFRDFEVICVDDGSTDSSLQIMNSYAQRDGRVRIIQQSNQGAGPARNAGLSHACGEYVLFFDADDIARKTMLEEMLEAAEKNGSDLTVCGSYLLDEQKQKIKECSWAVNHAVLPKKEYFSRKDIEQDFFTLFAWWPWDKLWRMSFLKSTGILFDSLRNTEDLFFCAANALMAERISVADSPLVIHRIGVSSSRSETRDTHCCDFMESLLHLRDFMTEKSLYGAMERDFINYAVPFSLWNMETLGGQGFLTVYKRLRESFFPEIRAFGRDEGYIRESRLCERLDKISKCSAEEALAERCDELRALAEHYRKKRHSKLVWRLKGLMKSIRLLTLRF